MVIIALWLAAGLSGCVQHEVTAPQLDTLVETVTRACQPAPPVNPIPHQLRLIIDGEQIDADAAGKRLLVDYAACYSAAAAGTAP